MTPRPETAATDDDGGVGGDRHTIYLTFPGQPTPVKCRALGPTPPLLRRPEAPPRSPSASQAIGSSAAAAGRKRGRDGGAEVARQLRPNSLGRSGGGGGTVRSSHGAKSRRQLIAEPYPAADPFGDPFIDINRAIAAAKDTSNAGHDGGDAMDWDVLFPPLPYSVDVGAVAAAAGGWDNDGGPAAHSHAAAGPTRPILRSNCFNASSGTIGGSNRNARTNTSHAATAVAAVGPAARAFGARSPATRGGRGGGGGALRAPTLMTEQDCGRCKHCLDGSKLGGANKEPQSCLCKIKKKPRPPSSLYPSGSTRIALRPMRCANSRHAALAEGAANEAGEDTEGTGCSSRRVGGGSMEKIPRQQAKVGARAKGSSGSADDAAAPRDLGARTGRLVDSAENDEQFDVGTYGVDNEDDDGGVAIGGNENVPSLLDVDGVSSNGRQNHNSSVDEEEASANAEDDGVTNAFSSRVNGKTQGSPQGNCAGTSSRENHSGTSTETPSMDSSNQVETGTCGELVQEVPLRDEITNGSTSIAESGDHGTSAETVEPGIDDMQAPVRKETWDNVPNLEGDTSDGNGATKSDENLSPASGPSQHKMDQWEARFRELCEYKKTHGHCIVPQREGSLGKWVSHQRSYYRKKKDGKKGTLTDERELKLEGIGFIWEVRGQGLDQWEDRFRELCEYKKTHGNCLVPTRESALGTWVMTQRRAYRKKEEGMQSPLTADREAKLEAIGFIWRTKAQPVPWEERFKELCEYKRIHGHCSVLQKVPRLGGWVNQQRANYRLKKKGKKSSLTDEREAALDKIGFAWVVSSSLDIDGISSNGRNKDGTSSTHDEEASAHTEDDGGSNNESSRMEDKTQGSPRGISTGSRQPKYRTVGLLPGNASPSAKIFC